MILDLGGIVVIAVIMSALSRTVSPTLRRFLDIWIGLAHIGVNATGDAGDTSPAIFGQPGTKYLISPAKSVKFLLSHAKRHGS